MSSVQEASSLFIMNKKKIIANLGQCLVTITVFFSRSSTVISLFFLYFKTVCRDLYKLAHLFQCLLHLSKQYAQLSFRITIRRFITCALISFIYSSVSSTSQNHIQSPLLLWKKSEQGSKYVL